MDYVLDENGNIKIGPNGKPLVKGSDGKEFEIDAIGQNQKLIETMAEAKGYRKEKAVLKAQLEAIPEVIREDPSKFVSIESVDSKTKEGIEKIKNDLESSYTKAVTEKDSKIKTLEGQLFSEKVSTKFATTSSLEGTIFNKTRSVAEKFLKDHFTVDEEGSLVGVGNDGKTIYSRESPGTPAGFDECVATIIDTHPDRDSFLAASGQKGGGSPPGDRSGGEGNATSSVGRIAAGLAERKGQ